MPGPPTPRDTLYREGTAALYRFRRPTGSPAGAGAPVLLVPSLINRWYILDLREGASLVEALRRAGLDVFCLDWGAPEDEDRYLSWEDVMARLARAVRAVRRHAGARQVALAGYCMGGTLAAIHAALHPGDLAALVNLAGPIDFAHAGLLGTMVDARWFDAEAIAAAGNVAPAQMQAGFLALRPTTQIAKWVTLADRCLDQAAWNAFDALESWASDNVAFPAAAYTTYIGDLYQKNLLVKGEHHVGGRRVDLREIRCPVLAVGMDRDTICPPAASRALCEGAADREFLAVPGGHVGGVVGAAAQRVLYPALAAWLRKRCAPVADTTYASRL